MYVCPYLYFSLKPAIILLRVLAEIEPDFIVLTCWRDSHTVKKRPMYGKRMPTFIYLLALPLLLPPTLLTSASTEVGTFSSVYTYSAIRALVRKKMFDNKAGFFPLRMCALSHSKSFIHQPI